MVVEDYDVFFFFSGVVNFFSCLDEFFVSWKVIVIVVIFFREFFFEVFYLGLNFWCWFCIGDFDEDNVVYFVVRIILFFVVFFFYYVE